MISIAGRLLFVGALLAVGTTSATAQAKHFRGNACLQTVSAGCAPVNVKAGACYDARLQPANYNGQPNTTRLSLFVSLWALNFTLPVGSLVGATFKPVNATALGQGAWQYNASARIPAMTPAAPNAATIFVSATIDINAFDIDAATCNVRLRFQGQRFPMP